MTTRPHLSRIAGPACRALFLIAALAVPLGVAGKSGASGPAVLDDQHRYGGGVGFVLLMSLTRNG
jgi:hypothetical protein